MLEGTQHLLTIRDWMRAAVTLFTRERAAFGQGSVRAWDEAAQIIMHVLHLPPDAFDACMDARVLPEEARQLAELLRRRVVEHTPAAYLTGGIWFGDLHFEVNPDVLIPRSYFVELIPHGFGAWEPEPADVGSILELCTGSGCLAVLLALAYPQATVTAVDLSPAALAVAQRNVAHHHLGHRIRLLEGDLFAPIGDAGPFDLIVANPPYEPSAHLDQLPPEFTREPRMALDGGADGLDVVLRLLAEVPRHLAPGGLLAVEVGGLRTALEAALPHLPFTWLQTQDGSTSVFTLNASDLQAPARRKPARRPS